MKKVFNVAVIGLGVGEMHMRGYILNRQTKLIYACDKNKLKLNRLKKKYKDVNFISNPKKIFEDKNIDIVSIATYDNSHFNLIMEAIKHKKHIFVEKPLCQNLWQLKKIELKLKKKNLILFSNVILRKSKMFKDLKKKIKSKFFGKIFHIEADYNYGRIHKIKSNAWRSKIPFYSITQGGGIHIVDLILWLTGKKVTSVFSYSNKVVTKNYRFKFDDNIISILKLEDNILAKVSVKFSSVNKHHHNLSIYGSKKTFENLSSGAIIHYDNTSNPKKINYNYKDYKKYDLINDFIKCLNNKKKYNFKEFSYPLEICFKIDKSAKINKEVK